MPNLKQLEIGHRKEQNKRKNDGLQKKPNADYVISWMKNPRRCWFSEISHASNQYLHADMYLVSSKLQQKTR